MVCIYNPSTEQLDALNRYADVLGSEDAAYYVLSQNNGYPLDKTPNGEDSDLYQDMISHFGSEEEAIRMKSMLYTSKFLEANGDWTVGDFRDPSMFDAKGEPDISIIAGGISQDLQEILNNQFLADPDFPQIVESDLVKVKPTDDLSDYAVDQLLEMSYSDYINEKQSEFLRQNKTASEDEKRKNKIKLSRQWYSRKVDAIMTEQVKALAKAFGFTYIQRPNGSVELQTRARSRMTALQQLRFKFLNNIVNDPLEDQLRTEVLGLPRMGEDTTLKVEGAPDYMHDALVRHVQNDKMLACNTLIKVSLTGGTSTTINKSMAYHYITTFIDSQLIQAGLTAVDDGKNRSTLYLVNKLIDVITTPQIAGVKNTSIVEKVFEQGIDQKMFDDFWDNFDNLLDQVINKGVKSEEARAKILSVVAAAFQTNDKYNMYTRPALIMPSAAYDYTADWYAIKYKPWGPQNDKQLNEIQAFLEMMERYYQNKIKRQERDTHVSKESSVRTQNALYVLEHFDKANPVDVENAIDHILETAYQEIREATEVINDISINGKDTLDIVAKLGSEYGNVVAFYNYIINVQMQKFFPKDNQPFPSKFLMYQAVKTLLAQLDHSYKIELQRATERFVDYYIDKYMDKNVVTDEQIRNAKANAHLELVNQAIYGDLKNYELWLTMNSLSKSSIVRQVADSIMRLNVNRDQLTLDTAYKLQEKLNAAKRAILKNPISWGGYIFSPRNFQLLFQERYEDGTPSGMFVRRLHYGNFFRLRKQKSAEIIQDIENDIQNKTGNIYFKLDTDDYGNPVFPEGTEWDAYYRKYQHEMNAFECENGHKRFLQEYYDIRIDMLSRDTIAKQDDIQSRIDIITRSVTRDKVPHFEDLTVEELRRLDDLYKEQDNLGNEYTIQGQKKTGIDLRMAQEIKAFRKAIKNRIIYETDEDKFEDAKNKVDPSKRQAFIDFSTDRDINPKFWEIYKVLQKEYRDKFPRYLDSAFDEVEQLMSERNDIVNTVKRIRYQYPKLRDIGDSAWDRIKELDELIEIAFEPIKQYKASLKAAHQKVPRSAFEQIGDLLDVMDIEKDPSKTLYDALIDEAIAEDLRESSTLGYRVYTHENEARKKYSRVVSVNGSLMDVPLSVFSIMTAGVFSDDIKARFGIDDSFEYVKDVPKRFFNKLVDPSSPSYTEPSLVDPEFDPDEGTYLQPKEENPAYKILSDPNKTPKEVFELYKFCIETKAAADSFIPSISTQSAYKLPMMRASDLAIMSRMLSRGVFRTIGSVFTNNFVANETDEDIIDDFTTLPDGTRVNSVPRKFIDNLPDMTMLTSDVVGSLVAYYHMAANLYFKEEVAPIYQALLQQVGSDQDITTETGQSHLILGKTTNQYAKLKNVIDSQLYDQKQIWGERGSQRITGSQKTWLKVAKFFAKMGTLAALSRNILSQTTGFIDASLKMNSFAFSGEAFNMGDIALGISIFDSYLVSGRLFLSTGEILPNNLIAAIAQKNNFGSEIHHKYQGGYKSQMRRVVGMERSGMGGFRVSDYAITSVLALAIYNNYRLLDNQFLPEVSFKNKLRRLGFSEKEINSKYSKAPTLLSAYNYDSPIMGLVKFGRQKFEMKDSYKQLLGESEVKKLEQNVSKAIRTWAPKLNGAVSDEDKAVIQQNILAGFTVALRSYLINEAQTRFVTGMDFQDPKISKKKLNILKSRRNALVKMYKSTYSESKKTTELDKLLQKKADIESQINSLRVSGDVKQINWSAIKTTFGLSALEGVVGGYIGSMFGMYGAIGGAILGGVHGAISARSNLKSKGTSDVGLFRQKLDMLETKLHGIQEQIRAINVSDNKDKIRLEIIQLNEEIIRISNKLNENQGLYDYARNIATNGSNRLAGKLLANSIRKLYNFININLPRRFQTLKATYSPKITDKQIRGFKRLSWDFINLATLWLTTQYMMSWYRYDDGRGFLGGAANEIVNPMMKASDEALTSVISPVMNSDLWKETWNMVHGSATEGAIHDVSKLPLFYGFDKAIEQKADAMLGYDKKVSRKDKSVTRVKKDPVARQISFLKCFAAVQSLKGFTEQVAPYDPQTINDLADAFSANLNVISKELEASQQMVKDGQSGTLYNPLQSGPYHGYFDRLEYGAAHSWLRPFGYPSSYEQTTEEGTVARMNFLQGTGINKYVFEQKKPVEKPKKPKKHGKHHTKKPGKKTKRKV